MLEIFQYICSKKEIVEDLNEMEGRIAYHLRLCLQSHPGYKDMSQDVRRGRMIYLRHLLDE